MGMLTGPLDPVALRQREQQLTVAAKLFSSFIEEQLAAPPQAASTRISAKDKFNLPGSATGEECLEMMRKKAEEKAAEESEKARNRDEKQKKKSRALAKACCEGDVLLTRIETQGEAAISAFTVNELMAVLQNAAPDKSFKKENRAALLAKVKALDTVTDAVKRHQDAAAATVAAATAPPAAVPIASETPNSLSSPVRPSLGSSDSFSPQAAPDQLAMPDASRTPAV